MKDLSIHIKVKRQGFTLSVNEQFKAGITGVFGHSGAGKTTLLQCISGVNNPSEGIISIGNNTLFCSERKTNSAIHKRNIAYVFQEGRLFPHMCIEKNLKYGIKKESSTISFMQIAEMLNITHILKHYPRDISGGERQRVALGRALLTEPDVLLLDEPFSALDQKLRQQIIPFIDKISTLLNIPILLVSHDLPDILKLTHRLCLMHKGQVVGHGNYEELIKNNSLLKHFPSSDLINSITLEVKDLLPHKKLVILNGCGAHRKIKVLMESDKSHYQIGRTTRVFLRPNDIVLAKSQVVDTSFQNQIEGQITQIIDEGSRVMCLIDCGFSLIAEVSKASAEHLQLKENQNIYCLFKSLAIDKISG